MSEQADLEKVAEGIAARLGVSKDAVIAALINRLLKERTTRDPTTLLEALKLFAGDSRSDFSINDLIKLRLAESFTGDSKRFSMEDIMALMAIKQLSQPDPMQMLMMMLLMQQMQRMPNNQEEGESPMSQLVTALLANMGTQQQQMTNLIMTALGVQQQKAKEEMKEAKEAMKKEMVQIVKRMSKEIEELKKDRESLIGYLSKVAEMRREPSVMEALTQAIRQVKEFQEAVKDAAESLGITKREIPIEPKTGKINWAALLDKVLDRASDLAKEWIKAQAVQAAQAAQQIVESERPVVEVPPPSEAPAPQIEEIQPEVGAREASGGQAGGEVGTRPEDYMGVEVIEGAEAGGAAEGVVEEPEFEPGEEVPAFEPEESGEES